MHFIIHMWFSHSPIESMIGWVYMLATRNYIFLDCQDPKCSHAYPRCQFAFWIWDAGGVPRTLICALQRTEKSDRPRPCVPLLCPTLSCTIVYSPMCQSYLLVQVKQEVRTRVCTKGNTGTVDNLKGCPCPCPTFDFGRPTNLVQLTPKSKKFSRFFIPSKLTVHVWSIKYS